jgi:hypothetical protein
MAVNYEKKNAILPFKVGSSLDHDHAVPINTGADHDHTVPINTGADHDHDVPINTGADLVSA